MRLQILIAIAVRMLMPSIALAQAQPVGESATAADQEIDAQNEPGAASEKMDHMADAMADMGKTCDAMMQRAMAASPWVMAALAILGVIGLSAFVLLVVLEVQWALQLTHQADEERIALGGNL